MKKELGSCPICQRLMYDDGSVDKHHFIPKSKGGRETEYIHKVCHSKIHSLFTEKELAAEYKTAEKLREHPEIQKFLKWVSSKGPSFYDRSKRSRSKPPGKRK
ncbi:MAG: HNH endonuclease [Saprospiraceae bacterium]|nr:HNH endonuclease [Saprospiraceae bacterium]MCB9325043.1 HNH endonuclease [Lewinellaceae bacterium]